MGHDHGVGQSVGPAVHGQAPEGHPDPQIADSAAVRAGDGGAQPPRRCAREERQLLRGAVGGGSSANNPSTSAHFANTAYPKL